MGGKCMKKWNLSYFFALVVLAMLPLAGCSGGGGATAIDTTSMKATVSGTVLDAVAPAAKAAAEVPVAQRAAATLGKVEAFDAYAKAGSAALGTADIQADGTYSGLSFTLPTKQSVILFKATLTTGIILYTLTPIDINNPPAVLTNGNLVLININRTSDAAAKAALTLLGASVTAPIPAAKTFADASSAVIASGGAVLKYTTSGLALVTATAVTVSQESCLVCHSANDVTDQVGMHQYTYDAASGTRTLKPRYLETNLAISGVTIATDATDYPVITFTVKNGSAAWTTLQPSEVTAYLGTLVPKGTVIARAGNSTNTGLVLAGQTFATDLLEMWGQAKGNSTGALGTAHLYQNGVEVFQGTPVLPVNATGVYKLTFPSKVAVAANAGAASTAFSVADFGTRATSTQRLWLQVSPTVAGMPAGSDAVTVGVGNSITDFTWGAAGGANAAVLKDAPQNQIVTIGACQKCHGYPMAGAAHASSRKDTLACVFCHSQLYTGGGSAYPLTSFIHQVHSGQSKPYDMSEITYPQPLTNCTTCHSNPNAVTLGTGDKLANWKNNATPEACLGCHTGNVKGAPAPNSHTVGIPGSGCVVCHTAANVTSVHTVATAAKNVPEYIATMTISAPASGTYYKAGETPTVTVTLKNADGSAVPSTIYTTTKHAAGTTVAGVLSKATLAVAGPRANAIPVLTKAAITLSPTTNLPGQSQSLFPDATDANIKTTTSGFSYKLNAIPANATSGTYVVRFIAQNYGYVSDTNYKIDSTAQALIQIGTATVEQKIAGATCVDCHGTGTLGAHDARHSVPFDTDSCNTCHDKSGNHANPINNRVHAIHSASPTGDALGLNWGEVTYPQGTPSFVAPGTTTPTFTVYSTGRVQTVAGAPRCIGCHTGTSGTGIAWKGSISQNTCSGCHVSKTGVLNHFKQNGGI